MAPRAALDHFQAPFEPEAAIRRRAPKSMVSSAQDDPWLCVHLRATLSTSVRPPGSLGRDCGRTRSRRDLGAISIVSRDNRNRAEIACARQLDRATQAASQTWKSSHGDVYKYLDGYEATKPSNSAPVGVFAALGLNGLFGAIWGYALASALLCEDGDCDDTTWQSCREGCGGDHCCLPPLVGTCLGVCLRCALYPT